MEIQRLTLEEIQEGQGDSFEIRIDAEMVDRFADLSGDISPLHMDDQFAQGRGFKGRVVHGTLISAFVSQALGVRFPGENCLLQSLNMNFLAPAFVNDSIRISVECDRISMAVESMTVKFLVENIESGEVLGRGKAQVGFTSDVHG